MLINKKDKSWNREATPDEKKSVLVLLAWVALCIVIAFFEPAVGIVLFPAGFLVWTIFA
jgi:hypothetical protein